MRNAENNRTAAITLEEMLFYSKEAMTETRKRRNQPCSIAVKEPQTSLYYWSIKQTWFNSVVDGEERVLKFGVGQRSKAQCYAL